MKKLSRLTQRTILLLFSGRQGTMEDNYFYCEESLYVGEGRLILDFCKWIDKEIGGCSSLNIKMLFKAYKNPNDKLAAAAAQELKEKIAEIHSLTQ